MTIAEIVEAFSNANSADEIFALLKETDTPVEPIDQQLVRYKLGDVLKRWKIPVKAVDEWLKVKAAERAVSAIVFPIHEPWPEPVEGGTLVANLEEYFTRFAHATPESILAAALWTLWTWVYDLFDIAPLLVLTSPTKRCGKTTMLKLIGSVAPRRLFSSNLTGAVLFRVIEKYRPTLLIDEGDTFARFNDDLRGLLNAGHERETAQATRTVGDDHDVKTLSTWAPKAFTAIGSLPDTVEDRSLRIVMLRKPADVKKDHARRRALRAAADPLASRCARWADDNALELRMMEEPELDALHDRAADNWAPLIMVAELCGVRTRAEAAALALTSGEEAGVGELLLAHVREAFGGDEWIGTAELLEALVNRDDGPWPKWWADDVGHPDRVKKASAGLARQLRKFDPELKAQRKRTGDDRARGYERAQFEDLWRRWLPAADQGGPPEGDGSPADVAAIVDDQEPAVPLAEPGDLVPLGPLVPEGLETPPLTSGNAEAAKGAKGAKVPEPNATHSPDAAYARGDIVRREGGLRSREFRVKRVVGDTVDCFELDHGTAGSLRSFRTTELILVRKAEEEVE
jgi:hypothetical protein